MKKLLDALKDLLDRALPRPEPERVPVPVRVRERPGQPPRR